MELVWPYMYDPFEFQMVSSIVTVEQRLLVLLQRVIGSLINFDSLLMPVTKIFEVPLYHHSHKTTMN